MDPFITPLYEKIIDCAVVQIVKQVGYLIHYGDNFKELDDKVNQLQGARQVIQHWIEEEERKHGNQREAYVQDWLDRVDNLNKEAEELAEDPRRAGVGCHRWSGPNLRSRHKLSKMAKEMAESVTKLEQVGNFVRVTFSSPTDYLESFYGALGFDSRMPVMNNMIEALKDPKKKMVGVYGLGGVGKTTLARQVANKAKKDNLFKVVVEAKVGENPLLEKIQDEIAELLGMKLEEKSVIKRADRVRKGIEKEKAILVILDDVRTTIELEEIGIPDPSKMNLEDGGVSSATAYNLEKGILASKADNVCKILMTSRFEVTLRQMGSEKNFCVDLLNDNEAWSLFKDMAGLDISGKHSSLRKIAPQVAQKCGGLPVVISAMAKTLKNRSISDWKAALRKLKRAETKEIQEIIHSAMDICYHWLENDEVKTLFLLCSVSTIRLVNDLLKYGIGLGIFKGTKTVEEARDNLYQMISSLKASSLFIEDTSMESVTMHDTIREVAAKIASKNQYFFTKEDDPDLEEWPMDDLKRCPLIAVRGNCIQKLPERLDCPKVEFFFLSHPKNRSLVIPHSFFEGMVNLKVLDLTGMILSSLPTSFASLTKLKTLCLDQCDLGDIAGIGALKNLEILSLLGSSMIQLPNEIRKLTRLRMLDLRNSRIEVFPPNVLSKLIKLEELYMGNCFIKWEVQNSTKQDRNASLAELRHLINLTALEIQIHDTLMLPKDLNFEKLEKYKIVIGDIWDWSENYEASTTLKLKLGDSEHWVKSLIKTVESMYLDEISDISTVLYQLNENELLKHLHIQNNAKIQHIVNSAKRNRAYVPFPNLETLALNNLSKLEKICQGPLMANSFSKLRAIKVKSCDQLQYLILVSMVKALSQLLAIEVSECKSMKRIVLMDCEYNDITIDKIEFTPLRSLTLQNLPIIDDFCSNELMSSVGEPMYGSLRTNIPTSFFNAKLAFPNLETLKLSSINLNNIWDDHQLPAVAGCIRNLANLTVENCGGLKYLFSPLMVESLINLKHLEISKCDKMEDIIVTEKGSHGLALAEVRFSKLEKITIKDMKNLKAVWHHQFDKLKMLKVINCDKLGNIFPSHMQRTFESLETLTVSDCNLVEEIFELSSSNGENGTTQLKQLTLLRLPKLKRIWSKDPLKVTGFHNLQFVRVEDCEDLQYLFPFSIATDLRQVEEISVKQAFTMKEIVPEKQGRLMDTPVEFKYENLTSLVLCNLHELKTFYAGNHSLVCPSLREINVFNCKKFKLFKTQCANNQGRISDSKLHVSKQQTVFNNVEEVIENLEVWTLNSEDASTILQCQLSRDQFRKLKVLRVSMFKNNQATFPYWLLQSTSSLEWLVVEWSSFKEIFIYEGLTSKNGNFEISTRIKYLRLHELHKLQHICKEGSQIDPLLEALEGIFVSQCSSLRHLVPSSIAFNHLTYLEVENCGGLVSLVTSSTARSLAKLITMKVTECNSLEQIVTEERDDANNDIMFASLELLELECLPRLNKFCSSECFLNFPLLEKVVVRQCPRMTMFSARETSTPRLLKVLVDENDEGYWEGNLNRTINKMSEELVAFHSLENLELSEYPELEELWYGQVGNKVFSNLKSLVVQKCDFLSDVLVTWNILQAMSNLEELDVRDCDSLEVVFDLNGMNEQEMQIMKENTQLKKITVSSLPKLKHIWKLGSEEIVSFEITEENEVDVQRQQPFSLDPQGTLHCHNLQAVEIVDCPHLEHLFPFSIAMDLPQLEQLHIDSCGMKEIVATKHGPMDKTPTFVLNHLTSLDLKHLYELTGFYAGVNSLKCQLLKRLNVFSCKKLKLFNIQPNEESSIRDELHFSMPQALFPSEEVIRNLEELTLNSGDANTILQGQLSWDLFSKLKLLRLSQFEDDQVTFPYVFLRNIPNLEHLVVEFCSFKDIFYDEKLLEDKEQMEISVRIKVLGLRYLHNLQHICKEGSQIDPTLKVLEELYLTQCSSFIHLVPSSVAFNYLAYLEVEDCNRMVSLISSTTARSLAKLTTMKIKNCNSLEQIVVTEEDETKDEIAFNSLEILELECLPKLNSFSSSKCLLKFLLLEQVLVKQCPSMRIFSAGETSSPELEKVLAEENDEECYWEGDLNQTITKMFVDLTTRERDGGDCEESSSSIAGASSYEKNVGQPKLDEEKKKEHDSSGDPPSIHSAQETCKANERPLVQDAGELHDSETSRGENLTTTSITTNNIETIKVQETRETSERPLFQDAQTALSPTSIQDAAEESHDREILPSENLFTQTTTSATIENRETDKAQEMCETIDRPLVQAGQNTLSPTTIQDAGYSGSEELHDQETPNGKNFFNQTTTSIRVDNKENNERPSVQPDHNALSPPTVQDAGSNGSEKSHDREILSDGNLLNQATASVTIHDRETPPQAAEAKTSPTVAPDAYTSYKGLFDISVQNLAYLEAGLARHPRVLEWLNPKRRRVFASSFFSLFADVTGLLRTTRRGDLSHEDRDYITQCCSSLEGVGFDASWLSYVRRCVEECGEGEMVKKTLEETEGKASTLKAQLESIQKELASVEASLGLLRHKASKLHDFIES